MNTNPSRKRSEKKKKERRNVNGTVERRESIVGVLVVVISFQYSYCCDRRGPFPLGKEGHWRHDIINLKKENNSLSKKKRGLCFNRGPFFLVFWLT